MARVLIVEHDPQISGALSGLLHRWGFDTRIEANGAAGLLAAHEDCPDVILVDLKVPILAGFELLQALRHNEHTAHVPIIALAEDDLLAGALTAGANVYLTKPCDSQALLSAVERLASLHS